MKIVVCIKQVLHTYARTGMDPQDRYVAPEDRVRMIDPASESALGLALKIRELAGEGNICLLTLGPLTAGEELRRCLALGADQLYQVDVDGGAELDSRSKSVLLSRALGHLDADLIICGRESIDTANGQIGPRLAGHLGLPCVASVRDVRLVDGCRTAEVRAGAGRGRVAVVSCRLPVVLTVEAGSAAIEHIPSVDDWRRSRQVPVQRMFFDTAGIATGVLREEIIAPRPRPKIVPAPDCGLDAFARIDLLLTGSNVEKKGEMLVGDIERQVDGIIAFLDAHGFLEPLQSAAGREGVSGG